MKHEYYEILVSGMIDGDINENEKSLLDEHMKKCAKCRKLASQFKMLSGVLHAEIDIPKRRKPTFVFSNIAKIAAIFVLAISLGVVYFSFNNNKASVVAENSVAKEESVESTDYDVFGVYTSYNAEEYSDEIEDSPMEAYFSYVDFSE